jgi:hypothetical protein
MFVSSKKGSVPGMRESIREGMEAPLGECTADLDW